MAVIMSKQMVIPSTLPPVGTPLNDCTWEQISEISNLGLASTYFKVGDRKAITLNGTVGGLTFSNLSIDTFILGINHNSSIEGGNKIHFCIGKIGDKDVALVNNKFIISNSSSYTGGWDDCQMRKSILGSDSTPDNPTANTLLDSLPADLLVVLKPIIKYTDNTGGTSNSASNVTATTEYLPLMAEFEVCGSRWGANSAEQNYQKQYDYFASGNNRGAATHDTFSNTSWWTRSSYYKYTGAFITVDMGSSYYTGTNYSCGVRPVFAV